MKRSIDPIKSFNPLSYSKILLIEKAYNEDKEENDLLDAIKNCLLDDDWKNTQVGKKFDKERLINLTKFLLARHLCFANWRSKKIFKEAAIRALKSNKITQKEIDNLCQNPWEYIEKLALGPRKEPQALAMLALKRVIKKEFHSTDPEKRSGPELIFLAQERMKFNKTEIKSHLSSTTELKPYSIPAGKQDVEVHWKWVKHHYTTSSHIFHASIRRALALFFDPAIEYRRAQPQGSHQCIYRPLNTIKKHKSITELNTLIPNMSFNQQQKFCLKIQGVWKNTLKEVWVRQFHRAVFREIVRILIPLLTPANRKTLQPIAQERIAVYPDAIIINQLCGNQNNHTALKSTIETKGKKPTNDFFDPYATEIPFPSNSRMANLLEPIMSTLHIIEEKDGKRYFTHILDDRRESLSKLKFSDLEKILHAKQVVSLLKTLIPSSSNFSICGVSQLPNGRFRWEDAFHYQGYFSSKRSVPFSIKFGFEPTETLDHRDSNKYRKEFIHYLSSCGAITLKETERPQSFQITDFNLEKLDSQTGKLISITKLDKLQQIKTLFSEITGQDCSYNPETKWLEIPAAPGSETECIVEQILTRSHMKNQYGYYQENNQYCMNLHWLPKSLPSLWSYFSNQKQERMMRQTLKQYLITMKQTLMDASLPPKHLPGCPTPIRNIIFEYAEGINGFSFYGDRHSYFLRALTLLKSYGLINLYLTDGYDIQRGYDANKEKKFFFENPVRVVIAPKEPAKNFSLQQIPQNEEKALKQNYPLTHHRLFIEKNKPATQQTIIIEKLKERDQAIKLLEKLTGVTICEDTGEVFRIYRTANSEKIERKFNNEVKPYLQILYPNYSDQITTHEFKLQNPFESETRTHKCWEVPVDAPQVEKLQLLLAQKQKNSRQRLASLINKFIHQHYYNATTINISLSCNSRIKNDFLYKLFSYLKNCQVAPDLLWREPKPGSFSTTIYFINEAALQHLEHRVAQQGATIILHELNENYYIEGAMRGAFINSVLPYDATNTVTKFLTNYDYATHTMREFLTQRDITALTHVNWSAYCLSLASVFRGHADDFKIILFNSLYHLLRPQTPLTLRKQALEAKATSSSTGKQTHTKKHRQNSAATRAQTLANLYHEACQHRIKEINDMIEGTTKVKPIPRLFQ